MGYKSQKGNFQRTKPSASNETSEKKKGVSVRVGDALNGEGTIALPWPQTKGINPLTVARKRGRRR